MPIIDLTHTELILMDSIVWFIFHMGISAALLKVPLSFFENVTRGFDSFAWEKNGTFWQTHFRVRAWKDKLPDGATLFKMGFKKKQLTEANEPYLNTFILESKRAELNHWLLIVPAPLFFLWNPAWAGWAIICYALAVNIPFIIIQRYNRPRFEKIQQKKKRIKEIKR